MKQKIESAIGRQDSIKHSEQQKEKKISKDNIKDLWDNIKCNNVCFIGVPEGKVREQGVENLFEEIMTENSPNSMKEKDAKIQDPQRIPKKMNPKRTTLRDIIIEMAKVKNKERILKAAEEEKIITYKDLQ